MIYTEDNIDRIEGPTPAGGVYALVYFYDEEGLPTTKDKACSMYAIEYDQNDKELRRTTLVKSKDNG